MSRLHLWNGHNSRTWCGRGYSPGLHVAKVVTVTAGKLVEHCGDGLPDRVCGACRRGMDRRLGRGRWWWKRVGGGKWLARRIFAER